MSLIFIDLDFAFLLMKVSTSDLSDGREPDEGQKIGAP
jgi:hypothetical protein